MCTKVATKQQHLYFLDTNYSYKCYPLIFVFLVDINCLKQNKLYFIEYREYFLNWSFLVIWSSVSKDKVYFVCTLCIYIKHQSFRLYSGKLCIYRTCHQSAHFYYKVIIWGVYYFITFQEFVECRRHQQQAPQVLFSYKEPPLELQRTDARTGDRIGYVTFGIVYVCHNNNVQLHIILRLNQIYIYIYIYIYTLYIHVRFTSILTRSKKIFIYCSSQLLSLICFVFNTAILLLQW